ncbi:MAG TPA: adenylate/guanylate cyclase domain-containing protein, partial [Nitrospina sp.]|nr:adenylate/guanylate cyclase domain-containing protein [Nitrospina sp.]
IVAIDEDSLKEEGRWPWSRRKMGQLVDRLIEADATAIGFDIFFPEHENYISPERFEEGIKKQQTQKMNAEELIEWYQGLNDADQQFAKSIERSERVILGFFVNPADKKLTPEDLEQLDFSQYSIVQRFDDGTQPLPLRQIFSVGLSIPELMNASNAAGYVSFVPEMDGVVRWVPTLMQHGEYMFPPFSLQLVREAVKSPLAVNIFEFGIDKMALGESPIPVKENSDILINYYGPAFTFEHISASDVLSGKVGHKDLSGKIIVVGATAAGIHDIHTSPFGPLYPGVEIHANIMESILQNDFLMRPEWLSILDLLMIAVSGLLLGLVAQKYKAYGAAIFLVIGMLGYLSYDFYLFTQKGLWVNTVYPIFTQIFVYSGLALYHFGFEQRQGRFIKGAFNQYLAPTVVNQLVDNPDFLKLGGERREITAFFSDVAGFSSISEKLEPEKLVQLLNEYLTEMTDIVLKYEGTVDKFEGDAIIAFFGAPLEFKDHASRTCLVAVEMQECLNTMRDEWRAQGEPELFMRIGIHTGPAVVGNMGSTTRLDYTMMGDSVNLAARLEGVNKQYKTYTMISESTYEQAKDEIEVRELDLIRVVGKLEPVKIYELLGKKGEISETSKQVLPIFNEGYELYKRREWNNSAECFQKVLEIDENDGPSLTHLERCITFQIHPPPEDWDGVYTMGSK